MSKTREPKGNSFAVTRILLPILLPHNLLYCWTINRTNSTNTYLWAA